MGCSLGVCRSSSSFSPSLLLRWVFPRDAWIVLWNSLRPLSVRGLFFVEPRSMTSFYLLVIRSFAECRFQRRTFGLLLWRRLRLVRVVSCGASLLFLRIRMRLGWRLCKLVGGLLLRRVAMVFLVRIRILCTVVSSRVRFLLLRSSFVVLARSWVRGVVYGVRCSVVLSYLLAFRSWVCIRRRRLANVSFSSLRRRLLVSGCSVSGRGCECLWLSFRMLSSLSGCWGERLHGRLPLRGPFVFVVSADSVRSGLLGRALV